MIWIILCLLARKNGINYELFRFQIITVWNCNPSTSTSYYSTNRNVESVSLFFTMHLRELFTLFSVLVLMMAPSECSDVLKHEDDMAQGGGLWTVDSNEELESLSDGVGARCCVGGRCYNGFKCGPHFLPPGRCCPVGMMCTAAKPHCI